jgi:hypothetical protein
LLLAAFLILFGLQFTHSPNLRASWAVVQLHRWCDPFLKEIGSHVGAPWPAIRAWNFLPLAVALGILVLKAGIDGTFRRLRIQLRAANSRIKAEDRAGASVAPAATGTQRSLAPAVPVPSPEPAQTTGGIRKIGRYEIIGELGRGAMGAVFRASDPQLGRIVAIKMISIDNQSPEQVNEYKRLFYREARMAGKMCHPGIITIHDVGEDENGQPYLVMEYVEGTTLDDVLAPQTPGQAIPSPPRARLLDIAVQVADALDYAHRHSVIHRDIKPANILVTAEGKVKIADFGIAKQAGAQTTHTGQLVGTPAFMSPEQIEGGRVDSRSDIFSFGVVLYWMFTGNKPFPGQTIAEVAYKIMHTTPPRARSLNPDLPADLELIIARCLNKEPAGRFQTAGELMSLLDGVRTKEAAP